MFVLLAFHAPVPSTLSGNHSLRNMRFWLLQSPFPSSHSPFSLLRGNEDILFSVTFRPGFSAALTLYLPFSPPRATQVNPPPGILSFFFRVSLPFLFFFFREFAHLPPFSRTRHLSQLRLGGFFLFFGRPTDPQAFLVLSPFRWRMYPIPTGHQLLLQGVFKMPTGLHLHGPCRHGPPPPPFIILMSRT